MWHFSHIVSYPSHWQGEESVENMAGQYGLTVVESEGRFGRRASKGVFQGA